MHTNRMRICAKFLAIASLSLIAPNLTFAQTAPKTTAAPTTRPAATVTKTSDKHRQPHVAPKPGEVVEMDIKELGNFAYDPDNGIGIPADVKLLNGATMRFHGFMTPMDQAESITQFALNPNVGTCCGFGGPPQIQHTIVVQCPKGKAVGYCPDEIVVEGKLTVQEKKDGDYVVSIFSLDVTSVKPAPK